LNYIFEIMRENQSFLLSKDKGKQTCDEVVELCNDAIDEVYIFAKRKDATEEFAKLALLSFIFHVLMPQSNALYVNLLLGNIPACFTELRLMTESLAKCYLADIKFPEQGFFQEKLRLLEKERVSTSKLLEGFDKQAVVLWGQLSQEWVHTKGIMDRVVTQIAQKSGVPGWALAIPMSYTDDDMNMAEELGQKVSQFRTLLKATIDKWKSNIPKEPM
ncbi:unnamed protein product, partial [marine sediment metagenome]